MSDVNIACPSCGTKIPLTESLAGPLLQSMKEDFEAKLQSKDKAIAEQRAKLKADAAAIAQREEELQKKIEDAVKEQREQIAHQEALKAQQRTNLELSKLKDETEELRTLLDERNTKLAESQALQLEMMKKRRELEDERRELELTIEKRLAEATANIRAKAVRETEEQQNLRVQEKEATIAAMKKQIEDLKRRAEQGSQQLQGEVLEMHLESTLASKFIFDRITPVGKGERGADVIHEVMSPNGTICGRILWETKRTKNWHGGWIAKLKDDQREISADVAILMSSALPNEIPRFGQIDGIWVTDFESAIPLAEALRLALIQVASTKAIQVGQQSKMELMYDYLTGPKFRHRVEAIIEKFSDMRTDLERERKVLTKAWAKREAQIEGMLNSTLGMYGDLEGIVGSSMPQIESLDYSANDED